MQTRTRDLFKVPTPPSSDVGAAVDQILADLHSWDTRRHDVGIRLDPDTEKRYLQWYAVPHNERAVNDLSDVLLVREESNPYRWDYKEPVFGPLKDRSAAIAEYRLLVVWLLHSIRWSCIGQIQNAVIRRLGAIAKFLNLTPENYKKAINLPCFDFVRSGRLALGWEGVRLDSVLNGGARDTEPAWISINELTFVRYVPPTPEYRMAS